MIVSISHKGLERFHATGSTRGIRPSHAAKLRAQLTALETATTIEDMRLPGYGLHQLSGRMKDRWAISVNGNWRLTFEFRDGNAHVVDYEDYH